MSAAAGIGAPPLSHPGHSLVTVAPPGRTHVHG
jgi:hypothetical protein